MTYVEMDAALETLFVRHNIHICYSPEAWPVSPTSNPFPRKSCGLYPSPVMLHDVKDLTNYTIDHYKSDYPTEHFYLKTIKATRSGKRY
jgi:hypothetical protein